MDQDLSTFLIDTHCHIDYDDYNLDRDEMILRASAQGVKYMINIGSTLKGSLNSVELSRKYPNVFAVVGCHPHDAASFTEEDMSRIKELAACPKVLAIGEIGLDYYRNLSPQGRQQEMFISFIRFARQMGLPIVIHSRMAEADTLRIIDDEKVTRGIVNCFSGDEKFLKACLDRGLYVSFTCNITYKKSQGLRDLVKKVPLDRFCLETDAPYLSPEGFRGKRNEPSFVRMLAQFVAGLRGSNLEQIASATTQNARTFFGIND